MGKEKLNNQKELNNKKKLHFKKAKNNPANEQKFEVYEFNLKLRAMSFLFIKKSYIRICVVWLSIFASSILVILSTMIPIALNNVKKGMISQFGKYNSYTEYQNTTLNVGVPKFNMHEKPDVDPNQPANTDWYGGTNPKNGGLGIDNRYDFFNPNGNMDEISFNEDVFLSQYGLTNFALMGYLGGIVISSRWVNDVKSNPFFQSQAVTETVCNLLGVPSDDPSRNAGVSGCITYVVRQNAPSFIQQRLFAQGLDNFYLSFIKSAYDAYKDNLFTSIDGLAGNTIDNKIKIKLWGLDNDINLNLKDAEGRDLLRDLYSEEPQYQNTDVFPCVLNLSSFNSMKVHHLLTYDKTTGKYGFKYTINIPVEEILHADGKWYLTNTNKQYWHLLNGESVFYSSDGVKHVANFNGDSGAFDYHDLVDYQVSSLAKGKTGSVRIVNLVKTVDMEAIGIADKQWGEARIYTSRHAANELSGHHSADPNFSLTHYFFSQPATAMYPQNNFSETVEDSWVQNMLNTQKGFNIASDGHPNTPKLYDYLSSSFGKSADIGIVPGGYGLFGIGPTDIYFNGRLTTSASNSDLTNFMIFNAYGAYDRFGLSNPGGKGWDPNNPAGGDPAVNPPWSAQPGSATNIYDNSSNYASPAVYSLFSKELVQENVDRVIILVLSVLYVVLAFLLVISLVIILVTSNIIIDDNKMNISALKVLGYSDKDISKIILGIYNYVVALAFICAIPVVLGLMLIITAKISTSLNSSLSGFQTHFTDFFEIWQIPVAAIIIFLVFALNIIINKQILNKIQAIDVLKK